MNTIEFLTEKKDEAIRLKAHYKSIPTRTGFEEINLESTVKEIEYYTDAIATIRAFNKITGKQLSDV